MSFGFRRSAATRKGHNRGALWGGTTPPSAPSIRDRSSSLIKGYLTHNMAKAWRFVHFNTSDQRERVERHIAADGRGSKRLPRGARRVWAPHDISTSAVVPNKVMARKRNNRKGRIIVRKFEKNLTLSTLGGDTVLKGDIFDDALNSDEYFISADVYMMKTGGTAGEGPLQVGCAHNDYTVGEILEALVNDAGANSNDLIPQEQGRRRVRTWGFFPGLVAGEVLNNGIKSRQKIKFPIGDGANLAMYVMNNSGSSLTTGTKIRVWGTSYSRKNG